MQERPARARRTSLALAIVSLVSGCGLGTAAAVSGGSGTTANASTQLTEPLLFDERESPATIRFTLVDAESDTASVRLAYSYTDDADVRRGPFPVTRLTHVGGGLPASCGAGCFALASAPAPGRAHTFAWAFVDEPGLGGGLVRDFQLEYEVAGGLNSTFSASRLGNDRPVTKAAAVGSEEVSAIVPLHFRVSDSSADPVDVRVEFRDVAAPGEAWSLARPAGDLSTPEFSFQGLVAPLDGIDQTFFWDTRVDLPDREGTVVVRFTATDGIEASETAETAAFPVDNNAEPTVAIKGDLVIANPDRRRGMHVPFDVRDRESDEVRVVFQWTREGEPFVELPESASALDAALANPRERRALRVCSEYPRFATGRAIPIDERTVRLPELGDSQAAILAEDANEDASSPLLAGRTLELLRPSARPEPVAASWKPGFELASPVAAVPIGDGTSALVLDAQGDFAWRLTQVELVTGSGLTLATSRHGKPTALALEADERSVLVASTLGSSWSVARVEIASGAVTELLDDGGRSNGPVHGLQSLGTNAALATVGDALLRLSFEPGRVSTILDGLQAPRGIVVDRARANVAYVAERDASSGAGTGPGSAPGRVLRVRLDSLVAEPLLVVPEEPGAEGLSKPTQLALEQHGTRLLVVCETDTIPAGHELCAIDLTGSGALGRLDADVDGASSLATGAHALRIAALPARGDLAVGGGLLQARTVVGYDPAERTLVVEPPFEVLPQSGERWRIRRSFGATAARPGGAPGTFVWDSSDAYGGSILFRATPRDGERGTVDQTSASKRVFSPFERNTATLGNGLGESALPITTRVVDIDGDGDRDVLAVYAGLGAVLAFLQTSPRTFSDPVLLGGCFPDPPGVAFVGPASFLVEDLDADGRLDVAVSGRATGNVAVFLQRAPLCFDAQELTGGIATLAAAGLAAGDVDADGDLDLVLASRGSGTLAIFRQVAAGAFEPFPAIVLGGPTTTPNAFLPVVADLDGDGDLDLAVAGFCDVGVFACTSSALAPPAVFVFVNEGTGFAGPRTVVLPHEGAGASFLRAHDVGGDGRLDLVASNSTARNIALLEQQSDAAFAVTRFLGDASTNDDLFAFDFADLDLDGRLDLVSANGDTSNLIGFLRDTGGSLGTKPINLTAPGFSLFTVSVTAADVDGDGREDLVSANAFSGNVTVFFREALGSYRPIPTLALGFQGGAIVAQSVRAADLDADGDLDVVATSGENDDLRIFFQTDPGIFAGAPVVLVAEGLAGPDEVLASDVDGDGRLDLVACYASPGGLAIFLQDPAERGSFLPPTILTASTPAAMHAFAAGDFDGDGKLDLAAGDAQGKVSLYYRPSDGPLVPPRTLRAGVSGIASIATADLDRDGDLDLAVADADGLFLFLQDADGFGAPSRVGATSGTDKPEQVLAVDLDADGDLELVAARSGTGTVAVFDQTAPGVFAPQPKIVLAGGMGTRSVSVADVDLDGDLDLVAANRGDNTLTLWRQTRPGRFDTTSPLTLGQGAPPSVAQPLWVELVDLDGEGDVDILFGGAFPTVFWGTHGVD